VQETGYNNVQRMLNGEGFRKQAGATQRRLIELAEEVVI
jgi:hypothetical protein